MYKLRAKDAKTSAKLMHLLVIHSYIFLFHSYSTFEPFLSTQNKILANFCITFWFIYFLLFPCQLTLDVCVYVCVCSGSQFCWIKRAISWRCFPWQALSIVLPNKITRIHCTSKCKLGQQLGLIQFFILW